MLETSENTVVDALATLEPRPKPLSEKRSAIEANREAIYAAKDRGCSWVQIAAAFVEVGLVVTPDALRFAINAAPRDLKKYPRRSIVGPRQKRRGRQSSVSKGAIQAGNADGERDEDRTQGARSHAHVEKATNAIAAEPPERRFPVPATASRFHVMEEKL
jgi:hypothetical protein